MRDRNHISYSQFHIKLSEEILRNLASTSSRRNYFSQELSLEFRPCELHRGPEIILPTTFRLLRTLAIIHWWLPEEIKSLVHVEFESKSFRWLNDEQRIEIALYLDSKESTIKYLFLTERYSGNEIFGNLLGNDLRELSRRKLVVWKNYPIPRKKVYRRGPKDKGSRRFVSQGPFYELDVRSDAFLAEQEELAKKHETLLQKTIYRILSILRLSERLE